MLAFPDSFSTKLGKKYCTKMFEWYLSTNSTFLFHMKIDNNIVGYCGGKIAGSLGSGSTTAMMQVTVLTRQLYSLSTKALAYFLTTTND